MEIKRIKDNTIIKVYGVQRDRVEIPSRNLFETVTWFLIWEDSHWQWVTGDEFVPHDLEDLI